MNVILAIVATILIGGYYSWTSRLNGMFFFGRTADLELRESAEGRRITRHRW